MVVLGFAVEIPSLTGSRDVVCVFSTVAKTSLSGADCAEDSKASEERCEADDCDSLSWCEGEAICRLEWLSRRKWLIFVVPFVRCWCR